MSTQFWVYTGLAILQVIELLYLCYIHYKQSKLEQEHLDTKEPK